MDIQSLKTSLLDTTKKIGDSVKPFVDKTLEFTGKRLASTELFIETNDEYATFLTGKRLIAIAFDDTNTAITDEVLLLLPLWYSHAVTDIATIRYMNTTKSGSVITTENYTLPIEMRVFYEGRETQRLQTFDAIKHWWSHRDYSGTIDTNIQKSETPENPENIAKSETPETAEKIPEKIPEESDPLLSLKK